MIGVFGGTFDPVHFGHLRTVLEIFQILQLDEMRVIPCATPPHRASPEASFHDRRAMLELGLRGQRGFVIDERESRVNGPSYTVATLQALRTEQPGRGLCLVLGMDAFLSLPDWHEWERLFELTQFAVVDRPGWLAECRLELQQRVETNRVVNVQELKQAQQGRILFCGITQLAITAARIRETLGAGGSIRYLVPDSVLEYIESHQLYRGPVDG